MPFDSFLIFNRNFRVGHVGTEGLEPHFLGTGVTEHLNLLPAILMCNFIGTDVLEEGSGSVHCQYHRSMDCTVAEGTCLVWSYEIATPPKYLPYLPTVMSSVLTEKDGLLP